LKKTRGKRKREREKERKREEGLRLLFLLSINQKLPQEFELSCELFLPLLSLNFNTRASHAVFNLAPPRGPAIESARSEPQRHEDRPQIVVDVDAVAAPSDRLFRDQVRFCFVLSFFADFKSLAEHHEEVFYLFV